MTDERTTFICQLPIQARYWYDPESMVNAFSYKTLRGFLILFTLALPAAMGIPRSICFADSRGPLQTTNRFAPHLMFLTPSPAAPANASAGRLEIYAGIDYTSIFVNEQATDWSVLIDMEMASFEGAVEYELNRRFRLEMRISMVSMNDGFMDDFLEAYHDTLDVPNYNRDTRPKDDFAYHLRKNGRDWFSSRPGGLHPVDGTVALRMMLRRGNTRLPLDADLQYVLKLPLGNADYGFGSGNFDHGFLMPMRLNRPPWYIFMTPGFVLPGKPDTRGPDVNTSPMACAFLGIEYDLNPGMSLLAQFNYYTSPVETTGIRQLDEDSLELSLGTIWQMTEGTALEVAFCEDLTRSAPDFSLHVGFRARVF